MSQPDADFSRRIVRGIWLGLLLALLVGVWFASPWCFFVRGTDWNVWRGMLPGLLICFGSLEIVRIVASRRLRAAPGSRLSPWSGPMGAVMQKGHADYVRQLERGFGLGVLFALLLGLPIGLWFASPWTALAGATKEWSLSRGFAPCMGMVWAGMVGGPAVMHASRTLPGARRVFVWYLVGAAAVALVFASGVVLFVFYPSPVTIPIAAKLEFCVAMALPGLCWVLAIGLRLGSWAAKRDEERRQKELQERLAALDAARAEYEAAIERRFGPLDDACRAAIQAWDADRLTDARRKLEDARSVEELDA